MKITIAAYCISGNFVKGKFDEFGKSSQIEVFLKQVSLTAIIVDDLQEGHFTILANSLNFISSKHSESGFTKV